MNKIFIFAVLCQIVLVTAVSAQKIIEKTLPVSKTGKVELNLKFGENISIKTWEKEEIYIKISVEINGGKLNDALLVDFIPEKTGVTIKTDFDEKLMKQGKCADCQGTSNNCFNGNCMCSTINYEVILPATVNLNVETISGNIELRGLKGPVDAKSISGFVDLNWPATESATLKMKTITGEVYSDQDISFLDKKEENPIVGYELKGTIKGGGREIHLESISNNIYLRKN